MEHRTLRRGLAAAAIAACLPYLSLKTAWLAGSTIGLNDPEIAHDPVMKVANAVTFFLDAAAVALALAFVTRWGRRLPGWLVAAPMWVGAGLLGAIAVALPVQGILLMVHPQPVADAASPIAPWVYAVVYPGFLLQGVCLLAGYWFYARDRWPDLLSGRLGSGPASGLDAWAWAALALAAVAAAAQLRGVSSGTALGVLTTILIGAPLLGAAALVASRMGRPTGLPRALVTATGYVATGAAASWGTYGALLAAIPNPLKGAAGAHPADALVHVALAVSGFALAAALGGGLIKRPRTQREQPAQPTRARQLSSDG